MSFAHSSSSLAIELGPFPSWTKIPTDTLRLPSSSIFGFVWMLPVFVPCDPGLQVESQDSDGAKRRVFVAGSDPRGDGQAVAQV